MQLDGNHQWRAFEATWKLASEEYFQEDKESKKST